MFVFRKSGRRAVFAFRAAVDQIKPARGGESEIVGLRGVRQLVYQALENFFRPFRLPGAQKAFTEQDEVFAFEAGSGVFGLWFLGFGV